MASVQCAHRRGPGVIPSSPFHTGFWHYPSSSQKKRLYLGGRFLKRGSLFISFTASYL